MVPRDFAIAAIRGYRRVISPAIQPRCKYYPSCSEYALEAISSYGAIRGLVLGGWRLLRCNPWSDGGVDPVGSQTLVRKPGRSQR